MTDAVSSNTNGTMTKRNVPKVKYCESVVSGQNYIGERCISAWFAFDITFYMVCVYIGSIYAPIFLDDVKI